MKRVAVLALLSAFAAGPAYGADPRPSKWCGWYMRQRHGISDVRFNLARHWASYGQPAEGPDVGVIVVWAHHVGEIVGRTARGWLVHSGNDGRRVRTRERSLKGAIAFRR